MSLSFQFIGAQGRCTGAARAGGLAGHAALPVPLGDPFTLLDPKGLPARRVRAPLGQKLLIGLVQPRFFAGRVCRMGESKSSDGEQQLHSILDTDAAQLPQAEEVQIDG